MADAALDIVLKTIRAKERTAKMVDHVVPHLLVKRDSVTAPAASETTESP